MQVWPPEIAFGAISVMPYHVITAAMCMKLPCEAGLMRLSGDSFNASSNASASALN
jgi:hypothetical protein